VALLECRGLAFGRSTWSVEGAPQPDTGRSVAVDQWARSTLLCQSIILEAAVRQSWSTGNRGKIREGEERAEMLDY
jgi:hypothetical protein